MDRETPTQKEFTQKSGLDQILELEGDPGQHLRRLDDDEKGLITIQTPGGPQKMVTINEPGLYSLVLKSRKPEAKAFKRWVTHEVIPSIFICGVSRSSLPASFSSESSC
ncbi:BRO-N domain-containing protein [Effusibacillus pohliae]|uniref:BRO-N domain-containing protein n=1 Tax=Effusibacillus pohliae TaxID=232270 RepID=UPI0009FC8A6E|nr:Bro-N domain-containing protein [Effusibacillus pohliae]